MNRRREKVVALYLKAKYENAILDGQLLDDVAYRNLDYQLRNRWTQEALKAARWPYMEPYKKLIDGTMRWVFEEK